MNKADLESKITSFFQQLEDQKENFPPSDFAYSPRTKDNQFAPF